MMKLFTKYFNDAGLLILRIGIGLIFIGHGAPKILGGPELWEKLGMAMGNLGINFMPVFWGFMAACSEFFGALFIILGLLFRPASFFMAFTMIVATTMHLTSGDPYSVAAHPMKALVVFISFIIMGPGKYALDEKIAAYFNRKSP
jgi:putative oxidoreductase